MMTLETAVSRILDTLQSNEASNQEQASPQFYSGVTGIHDNTAGTTTPPLMLLISGQPESRSTRLMLSKSIKEVGNTYISFCADQPLPLFPRTGFIESLFDRADSVLFFSHFDLFKVCSRGKTGSNLMGRSTVSRSSSFSSYDRCYWRQRHDHDASGTLPYHSLRFHW